MAIKIGDVVRLKSGGTKMVVSHFSDDGDLAQCYWQNVTSGGVEACGHVYPLATLERDEAAKPAEPVASEPKPSSSKASEAKSADSKRGEPQPAADVAASPSGRRAAWLNTRT